MAQGASDGAGAGEESGGHDLMSGETSMDGDTFGRASCTNSVTELLSFYLEQLHAK